eukprot:8754936-Alexandrium_andersonii.AAC.1
MLTLGHASQKQPRTFQTGDGILTPREALQHHPAQASSQRTCHYPDCHLQPLACLRGCAGSLNKHGSAGINLETRWHCSGVSGWHCSPMGVREHCLRATIHQHMSKHTRKPHPHPVSSHSVPKTWPSWTSSFSRRGSPSGPP